MQRGRPLKTEIREKIAVILKYKNASYGYEIFKIYKEIFGNISLRNLYYNLNKGLELGEFLVLHVKKEGGEFTWGDKVERKYCALGPHALFWNVTEKELKKLNALEENNLKINWDVKAKEQIKSLKKRIENFKATKERMGYEEKWRTERKLKQEIKNLKFWVEEKSDKNKYKKDFVDLESSF